ncbi:PH domain-containing protein [Rhizohabitans arisaemae]|uniref:PH domain-containing protein n=1 Tax=Rhizohabitans arisaemae TaxID=2720610 RepID=UPI0024B1EF9E|nr:PH domain-containing protein [Rhizohabitans arisaemae]
MSESQTRGWERLDRKTHLYTVLSVAQAVPLFSVPVVVFLFNRDLTIPLIAAAVVGLALLAIAAFVALDFVYWRVTWYRVTPERFELRSGLFIRKHQFIPRDRIRVVDFTAKPVHRVLGLRSVVVGTGEKTGGDSQDEFKLDPISLARAEELRRELLDSAAPAAVQAQEQAQARGKADPAILTLNWAWIRYAPLTVWMFVGGTALVFAIYRALDTVGEPEEMQVVRTLWAEFTALPIWLMVVVAVAANLLVGLIASLVFFAEAWWQYRLERESGDTLRIRRGLLTAKSITLKTKRLRGVEIAEPLPLRWGGGARVNVIASGLKKDEEGATESAKALAPPLPVNLAERVGAEVLGDVPVGEEPVRLRVHPPTARRRRLVGAVVTPVILTAGTGLAALWIPVVPAWAPYVTLALIAPALLLALDAYRSLGHRLSGGYLIARSGTFVRRKVSLRRTGIVGFTLKQSILQRRLGLLTVEATTAAGSGAYQVVDVAFDEGLALADRAVPGLLTPFIEYDNAPAPVSADSPR